MKLAAALALPLTAVLAGCGWSPTLPGSAPSPAASAALVPAPASAPAPAPPPPPAAAAPAQPMPAGVLTERPEIPRPPAPSYDTRGRRDPFEVLETREGASGTTVNAARLAGVVRGHTGPMALIETPDGLGYILRPGDTLGDGRLIEVLGDSVVFTVPLRNGGTSRVVLKLPGDS